MGANSLSVVRYYGFFALIYSVLMLVANVFLLAFDIDLGWGVNIAMLFGAGYGTALKFVSDHKRAPNNNEKKKLVWGSLAICVFVSVLGLIVLAQVVGSNEMWPEIGRLLSAVPIVILISIMLAVTALHYALLSLMYGWGAKKYAQKIVTQ